MNRTWLTTSTWQPRASLASLSPLSSLAKLIHGKTPEQEAAGKAADAQRPVAKPFTATPEDVQAMLIRSATSDATLAETAALYAKIGLAMGSTLLINDGFDEARLQAGLNKFKP